MHAQVDQRAAAGALLVAEPAAREALAAQVGGLGVVDFAELVVVDEVLEQAAVVAEAAHKADHQQLAVPAGGVGHRLGLLRVHGHGLLAQHVLAGVQGGDGALGVRGVPGAHADRVELRAGREHVVHVQEAAGRIHMILVAAMVQVPLVDVAQGVELHVRVLGVGGQMHAGNAAAADDGDLEFLVHDENLLFFNKMFVWLCSGS